MFLKFGCSSCRRPLEYPAAGIMCPGPLRFRNSPPPTSRICRGVGNDCGKRSSQRKGRRLRPEDSRKPLVGFLGLRALGVNGLVGV